LTPGLAQDLQGRVGLLDQPGRHEHPRTASHRRHLASLESARLYPLPCPASGWGGGGVPSRRARSARSLSASPAPWAGARPPSAAPPGRPALPDAVHPAAPPPCASAGSPPASPPTRRSPAASP